MIQNYFSLCLIIKYFDEHTVNGDEWYVKGDYMESIGYFLKNSNKCLDHFVLPAL